MLQITLSAEEVGKINATGQKVTLVKALPGVDNVTQPPAVAWLAFMPMQNNEISWQADYHLYATTTPIAPNATIFVNSEMSTVAVQTTRYGYQNNLFVAGTSQLSPGQYGVINEQADGINFGLLQPVAINNGPVLLSPINIVPMLYKQVLTIAPREMLYIFLSYPARSGAIVSGVTSEPFLVDLTNTPSAMLGFDNINNQFFVTSGATIPGTG